MNKLLLFDTMLISLTFAAGFAPLLIPFFKRLKLGQYIRQEGPSAHLSKAGTPTFGAAIFLIAVLLTTLVFANFSPAVFSLLIALLGYGTIGWLDDYIKVIKKDNKGLSAKRKMFGLFVVTSVLFILFFKDYSSLFYFDLFKLSGLLWAALFFFIALAMTNAVNLTDGLDGLCGSVSLIVVLFLAALSVKRGAYDLALINMSMAGGLVGYLIYNWHPAKVFMGDMGSLALGGYIFVNAVLLGIEWWIPLFGGVYLLETLSVIIQVGYFKATGGKRFFKMSPLHHHFELIGWSEVRVVATASALTLLLCAATYLIV